VTTDSFTDEIATDLAKRCHPACIACGSRNGEGLGLQFVEEGDSVVATFGCDTKYQGYPDRLHGGVIAMLADAAMTHCLFVRGINAVTAKLTVKFRNPVAVGTPAKVRARLVSEAHSLFVLKAEILQGDSVQAQAEGLFMAQQLVGKNDQEW